MCKKQIDFSYYYFKKDYNMNDDERELRDDLCVRRWGKKNHLIKKITSEKNHLIVMIQ